MQTERMSIEERYKYLRMMQKRYREGDRKEKVGLLDEMEEVTGMHRKSLTRLMNGFVVRNRRKKERGKVYGHEVDQALKVIARSLDYPCAERLQPNLVWVGEILEKHGEMKMTAKVRKQLGAISVSTVRRRMKRIGVKRKTKRRKPEEANRLRRSIPTSRIAWDEQEPGHFEVDLVHHCGISASGQYVHTLQMVDVATGWSERAAVLGRSYLVMEDSFKHLVARIPFPILEVHPDNGSEFFNSHILKFWAEKVKEAHLSRSRPYQKNDNRFVEQKNDTLVRAYMGYRRLDTVAHTHLLGQIYDLMWVYHNFFQPVMRLQEKIPLPSTDKRLRYTRRFDQARPPFDRLCDTHVLHEETILKLKRQRDAINPLRLRQKIYDLIDRLFSLPMADPEIVENVYDTLERWRFDQQSEILAHHFEQALNISSKKGEYRLVTLSIE